VSRSDTTPILVRVQLLVRCECVLLSALTRFERVVNYLLKVSTACYVARNENNHE
jgi:hypothetical protein